MSTISTHVLDTALGTPAEGLQLSLEIWRDDDWQPLASGVTNADGRVAKLVPTIEKGMYQMTFMTERYCRSTGRECFYPYVSIVFQIMAEDEHYHVPLLLSPFGYSTYRGS